eukprot:SAG11_NODE_21487_length_424_cov_0.840000_1_plen_61_part_00
MRYMHDKIKETDTLVKNLAMDIKLMASRLSAVMEHMEVIGQNFEKNANDDLEKNISVGPH